MADFPEMIGKYKVTAIIAKGGMGTVYKAIHPSLKRNLLFAEILLCENDLSEKLKF